MKHSKHPTKKQKKLSDDDWIVWLIFALLLYHAVASR